MAQESGRVNAILEAYLLLSVDEDNSLECLVDTGFSGALVLPQEFVARLNTIEVGRELFNVVGGNQMEADIVLVEVEWLGIKRLIRAIVSEGDDALIGTELLDGTVLTVDYIDATVKVTKPQ
jgi:clan AA aspartic protease